MMKSHRLVPYLSGASKVDKPDRSTYDPIKLVTPAYPPTWVLVATKDTLIPSKQSYDFWQRLQQNGVECGFSEADMPHAGSETGPGGGDTPENEVIYQKWFEGPIKEGLEWVIKHHVSVQHQ
jgi:acetyl esterase/lipase